MDQQLTQYICIGNKLYTSSDVCTTNTKLYLITSTNPISATQRLMHHLVNQRLIPKDGPLDSYEHDVYMLSTREVYTNLIAIPSLLEVGVEELN